MAGITLMSNGYRKIAFSVCTVLDTKPNESTIAPQIAPLYLVRLSRQRLHLQIQILSHDDGSPHSEWIKTSPIIAQSNGIVGACQTLQTVNNKDHTYVCRIYHPKNRAVKAVSARQIKNTFRLPDIGKKSGKQYYPAKVITRLNHIKKLKPTANTLLWSGCAISPKASRKGATFHKFLLHPY